MKNILIDVLFGIIAIIIVTIFEFLVTIPFGEPGEQIPGGASSFINRELLLTALPAAITTFLLAWLLKTKVKSDSLRRAIIWTLMLALYYIFVGLGNNNLSEIFLNVGIYILLCCAFVGPIVYAKIKHLQ